MMPIDVPFTPMDRPLPAFCLDLHAIRHPCSASLRLKNNTMSRTYKIALILKSRSSLPVYRDLARLSDRELDEQVLAMIKRMRTNESAVIARMVLRQPTFSLN